MTKQVIYRCDLCCIRLSAGQAIGLFWCATGVCDEKLSERQPEITDHHICMDCLGGLTKIAIQKGLLERK